MKGHARYASPMASFTRTAALALTLLAAACAPRVVTPPTPETPTAPPPPATATQAGVTAGPALPMLTPQAALTALQAFRISCPALLRRQDASGLTQPHDWAPACTAASTWPDADAAAFFPAHFETARIGNGEAFATGYFEPQIRGARVPGPGFEVPVYRKPADLLETDPTTGQKKRGRLDESGRFVPYYSRGEIQDGALAGKELELAWAADPIELFFLEIQGSGRLLLPDGQVMRIGYAGQNGHAYTPIGRVMRERGILQPGGTSMQHIVAWLRANPEEGRAIMRENASNIFFQELTGPGPLGALGLPVTPRGTVAADPAFVPLGAPVLLDFDRDEADGLWVAQDTGGAIKGANRFDTFWGAGDEAARIAGGLQGKGSALLLLPKGVVARHSAR